jgi:hypothetical protein
MDLWCAETERFEPCLLLFGTLSEQMIEIQETLSLCKIDPDTTIGRRMSAAIRRMMSRTITGRISDRSLRRLRDEDRRGRQR